MSVDSYSEEDSISNGFSSLALPILCENLTSRMIFLTLIVDKGNAESIVFKTDLLFFLPVAHFRSE